MSAASSTALFTANVTEFWSWVTSLVPVYVLFGIGVSIVSILIYLVIKAPRHMFGSR